MSNRTSTQSSRACSPIGDGIRKRVGKACDRCRMKKSKCDGATPCSKCKADNSICAYGRRKRSYDKLYPKGYVEMLEHQQAQLVLGLQELYRRSVSHSECWDGEQSVEISPDYVPKTHDLLAWLGALQHSAQGQASKPFYDDFYTMQAVAILEHPATMNREASSDSTQTTSETAQSPTSEPLPDDVWDLLDSKKPFTRHCSQVPAVESPQVLPRSHPSSTTQSVQTLSQIPWLQRNTGSQLTDSNTYDPWTYNTDIQSIYTTEADFSQKLTHPAGFSIDPCLTLRDRSILDTYQLDTGFLYT